MSSFSVSDRAKASGRPVIRALKSPSVLKPVPSGKVPDTSTTCIEASFVR